MGWRDSSVQVRWRLEVVKMKDLLVITVVDIYILVYTDWLGREGNLYSKESILLGPLVRNPRLSSTQMKTLLEFIIVTSAYIIVIRSDFIVTTK